MLRQWGLEAADDLGLETCSRFKESHAVLVVVSSSSLYSTMPSRVAMFHHVSQFQLKSPVSQLTFEIRT